MPPTKTRPQTPARGAADERAAWMEHLRASERYALKGGYEGADHDLKLLRSLLKFGAGRAARTQARPKGLGRKKAAPKR